MISILIPTYNYNVYPLVREIHKQASKTNLPFEILVYDDASTQDFNLEKLLAELDNVSYKKYTDNLGRVPMLKELVQNAKYNLLLTMDADVFPKDPFFFIKLIKQTEKIDADLYYGGTGVAQQPPSKEKLLRWKFGKERESPSLTYRKQHPYDTIVCQSTLVKKQIFQPLIDELMVAKDYYGLDIFYSYLLKKYNKKVEHYDNKVVHLGIDDNASFLEKSKKAVETYRFLYQNNLVDQNHIKLVRLAEKYAPYGLCFLTKIINTLLGKPIRKNLLSTKPSLFLLDMYKLIYYCSIRK